MWFIVYWQLTTLFTVYLRKGSIFIVYWWEETPPPRPSTPLHRAHSHVPYPLKCNADYGVCMYVCVCACVCVCVCVCVNECVCVWMYTLHFRFTRCSYIHLHPENVTLHIFVFKINSLLSPLWGFIIVFCSTYNWFYTSTVSIPLVIIHPKWYCHISLILEFLPIEGINVNSLISLHT